jgi:Flp pilus assembly pilin Flp
MSIGERVGAIGSWLAARLNVTSDRGSSAVEYAIMIAMIAAVIIVAVLFLGQRTSGTFSCTAGALRDHGSAC